jgi:hypothetical protein
MGGTRVWINAMLTGAALMGVATAAGLTVKDNWAVPGPVAWDYLTLDNSASHLFVTRNTQVDVLDTHSGKVVATIAGTSGAHGVALAENARRGYISNGKSDTVTMFDLDTFKTLQEAPVGGHNPDAILYDAARQHLFTFNGRSSDVSVLSPIDLKVQSTFKVPGKPEFAVSDDQGQIFVNIETEPGQMVVIDAGKLQVKAVWTLSGCNSPSGLSIDRAHRRLFSVCDDKIMVVTDAASGKQVAKVAIGEGPDAVAYDARRALVLSSNGEGTLTIVHQDDADSYSVVQTLATKNGSRTMAWDGSSGTGFLSSARKKQEHCKNA